MSVLVAVIKQTIKAASTSPSIQKINHVASNPGTDKFREAFWPSFWATMSGVALGGILTVMINRGLTNRAAKKESQKDIKRFDSSMGALLDSLSFNQDKLYELQKQAAERRPLDVDFNMYTWNTVKLDIRNHLPDPKLYHKLEFYHSKLASVLNLRDTYMQIAYNHSKSEIADDLADRIEKVRDQMLVKINEANGEIGNLLVVLQSKEMVDLRIGVIERNKILEKCHVYIKNSITRLKRSAQAKY